MSLQWDPLPEVSLEGLLVLRFSKNDKQNGGPPGISRHSNPTNDIGLVLRTAPFLHFEFHM